MLNLIEEFRVSEFLSNVFVDETGGEGSSKTLIIIDRDFFSLHMNCKDEKLLSQMNTFLSSKFEYFS